MSTRGWVTVNVYWLVNRGPEEVKLVPPSKAPQLQLCPHAFACRRQNVERVPDPVHVSGDFCFLNYHILSFVS